MNPIDTQTNFSGLITSYLTSIQKKLFEERRRFYHTPHPEYARWTPESKVCLYWYVNKNKLSINPSPHPQIKSKWITEVHLGNEQKIYDDEDPDKSWLPINCNAFFRFKRPIIDLKIASQHALSDQFRALKSAHEAALDRIKTGNQNEPNRLWRFRARSLWNVIRKKSCFSSCCCNHDEG